jgi:hypothetical protein
LEKRRISVYTAPTLLAKTPAFLYITTKRSINMKNKFKFVSIAFLAIFTFSSATCFGQSSGQTINSPEALKTYLDRQPANGPDKPIKVTMAANAPMLPKIAEAMNSAGKYVSLNLSGNALTTIPDKAFYDDKTEKGCETLVSVTIPDSVNSIGQMAFYGCTSLTSVTIGNSVTSIGQMAFRNCTNLASVTIGSGVTSIGSYAFFDCKILTSVTFQGTIASGNFDKDAFDGDLRAKYLAGGRGRYTRPNTSSNTWTKQ